MEIDKIIDLQREYFFKGNTRNINDRIKIIKKLKKWIIDNEKEITKALYLDLNKSEIESYMCEIGMVLSDIDYQLKHIKRWSRKKYVHTPLAQIPSVSFEVREPYGVTLIMSPWNYPFLLSVEPMIDSLICGNTVVLKPSAYAKNVSLLLKKMVEDIFPLELCYVVLGGRNENSLLLECKFDYIFFTGSVNVGKLVMEKASQNLTPVTLELGGKSPCIINDSNNLKVVAKRIAFGKYLNAGQTCVAPDYVMINEKLKDDFIKYLKDAIDEMFSDKPLESDDLVKIINEKHFNRLLNLLDKQNIVIGGKYNKKTNKIEPTVIDNIDKDNKIMQEEIFGPILPIMTYRDINEVINYLHTLPKPLAGYIFSSDKKVISKILNNCSFGGGCINDTIIHLATNKMGFGGVGNSGIGRYHGINSFNTFTHTKSIVKKGLWLDIKMRYYPLNKKKYNLIKKFMR